MEIVGKSDTREKRWIVVETCARESVMIGVFKTNEEAQDCMKRALLEHLQSATGLGNGDPQWDDMIRKLDEPDLIDEYEDRFCLDYSCAWSNVSEDNMTDWNIFEVPL